jgi:uncharacterized protein YjeT (DUF2065 family)
MSDTLPKLIFAVICCVFIIQGWLQCFAPAKLKQIQDRLRPQRFDWSKGGSGFFERLREKQARNPSLQYRLGGLVLMGLGVFMLIQVLVSLLRHWG